MKNINWAVLGTGVIANEMALALKKNGKNILVNWPSLLMKTNVHLQTHVFQWLTICKKSSKMLTMVTKNVQDVVNRQ